MFGRIYTVATANNSVDYMTLDNALRAIAHSRALMRMRQRFTLKARTGLLNNCADFYSSL